MAQKFAQTFGLWTERIQIRENTLHSFYSDEAEAKPLWEAPSGPAASAGPQARGLFFAQTKEVQNRTGNQ